MDNNKKLFFWTFLVVATLLVIFAPVSKNALAPQDKTFRIEARQYAYSPGIILVQPGDTVTLELVSTDVVHGLYVDGYDISVEADPGQIARLTFVADKPGAFRLRCNVTCGAMHPFMIGRLIVGANTWLYRSWGLAVLAIIAISGVIRQRTQKARKKDSDAQA